jgi:hypothetical protein
VDEIVANAVEPQIETLRSPWFRFFVTYDPVPALKQLDVPVMALFGGKDLQVPAGSNSPAMIDALQGGATPDSYISTLPDANHLFQQAETGNPNEYGTIKEFAFGFLDEVTDWILQRTEPSA